MSVKAITNLNLKHLVDELKANFFVNKDEKGVPGGVAALDANGKVRVDQIGLDYTIAMKTAEVSLSVGTNVINKATLGETYTPVFVNIDFFEGENTVLCNYTETLSGDGVFGYNVTVTPDHPNVKAHVTYRIAEADANAASLVSEGFARGTQNGVEVTSTSPYYHNNAKYYSEVAGDSESIAIVTQSNTYQEVRNYFDAGKTLIFSTNVNKKGEFIPCARFDENNAIFYFVGSSNGTDFIMVSVTSSGWNVDQGNLVPTSLCKTAPSSQNKVLTEADGGGELPIASNDTLGGVKIASFSHYQAGNNGLNIDVNGVLRSNFALLEITALDKSSSDTSNKIDQTIRIQYIQENYWNKGVIPIIYLHLPSNTSNEQINVCNNKIYFPVRPGKYSTQDSGSYVAVDLFGGDRKMYSLWVGFDGLYAGGVSVEFQDKIAFNTAYNATTNKAATMADIPTTLASLSDDATHRIVTDTEKSTWNSKMAATDPTGTGSFSLNRKANTTIGLYSAAEGSDATASGAASHAEGLNTTASGAASHAEGSGTTASGNCSHAEGNSAIASGANSHAEGNITTASGVNSHAEGKYTTASGNYQHVQGYYNVVDQAGSNAIYADIIGNGTASNDRKNIEATTWTGDKRLKGDVYVGCNDDSTGGTKLAKITDIPTVPSIPSSTSMLKGDGNGGVTVATEYTDFLKGSHCLSMPSANNKLITLEQGGQMKKTSFSGKTFTLPANQHGEFEIGGASLIITLGAPSLTGTDIWSLTFVNQSASLGLTVIPPSGYSIKWKDGIPSFTGSNTLYEVSFMLHYDYIIGICSECALS